MKPDLVYQFGGHTLDLARRRLHRNNQDVALRPKSLALLVYLIENPGRVIDKEELIGAVWPNSIVSDDSLSQCLKDVRSALGAEAESLIRTVPRRGYILDEGQVQRRSELPALQSQKPSLAVFSFRPLALDREHTWFADGLGEDIAAALTRSRQLLVVPRSRPADQGSIQSVLEDTSATGIRYVVDGSVRLVSGRIRVMAQLLDAHSGALLWADRFDRYVSDIFDIHDEIVEAVVKHLEIELLPEERHSIQLPRTDSMEAYTYYRHGWQLARHWSKAYLMIARRMFAQAVALDASFARAHCALALCDCFLLEWFASRETPGSILVTADRALALDPNLAQAHVARGLAFQRIGDVDKAQAAFAKALAIDPACYEARLFAGFLAWICGRRDIAKAHFVEAAQLRREDYLAPYFVLAVIERTSPEKFKWAQLALQLAERAAVLQPENPALLSRGAIALTHLGRSREALSWIRRDVVLDPDDPVTNYNAASVYSVTGDQDAALRFLEIYVQQSSEDMVGLVKNDDDLAGVREHPGYHELLKSWRPPV
jgi:adenylate cyclase